MATNKEYTIKFRCTAFEKSLIQMKAHQTGVKVSEYCRTQILKGKIISRPRLTEEEKEFFRSLKNHNTNFWGQFSMRRKIYPKSLALFILSL